MKLTITQVVNVYLEDGLVNAALVVVDRALEDKPRDCAMPHVGSSYGKECSRLTRRSHSPLAGADVLRSARFFQSLRQIKMA